MWHFYNFQYGFRSQSFAKLLTVASGRIAKVFYTSGATQTAARDIFKAFGRIWYTYFLHKLMEFLVRYLD